MQTIFWDIDDVLNDLMKRWFEDLWLRENPQCTIKYSDIKENPPHRILGVTLENYLVSLDHYREKFYRYLNPRQEIISWFEKYGDKARHIAVSAVPLSAVPASAEWLFSHYGLWIRTIHVVPSFRQGEKMIEYDKSKADFFVWLSKKGIFVDDNEANFKFLENSLIKCVLWPQPWNSSCLSPKDTLEILTDFIRGAVHD